MSKKLITALVLVPLMVAAGGVLAVVLMITAIFPQESDSMDGGGGRCQPVQAEAGSSTEGAHEAERASSTSSDSESNSDEESDLSGVPKQYRKLLKQAANTSGISAEILAAQIEQESNWNPDAKSPVGAQGIAQFMPATWSEWGEGSITDPEAGIKAQGRYMSHLRDQVADLANNSDQEIKLALAAYNAGPGAVEQHGGVPPYAETQNYVATILGGAQSNFSANCAPVAGEIIGDVGSGDWTLPLPGGTLTSGFGHRGCFAGVSCNKFIANHHGLDFSSGGSGMAVAPTDMKITSAGSNQWQGEYVVARQVIDGEADKDGMIFEYHHCAADSTTINVGDTVAVGEQVCQEGSTGNANGAHIHFQINAPEATSEEPSYDHAVDPAPILRKVGIL